MFIYAHVHVPVRLWAYVVWAAAASPIYTHPTHAHARQHHSCWPPRPFNATPHASSWAARCARVFTHTAFTAPLCARPSGCEHPTYTRIHTHFSILFVGQNFMAKRFSDVKMERPMDSMMVRKDWGRGKHPLIGRLQSLCQKSHIYACAVIHHRPFHVYPNTAFYPLPSIRRWGSGAHLRTSSPSPTSPVRVYYLIHVCKAQTLGLLRPTPTHVHQVHMHACNAMHACISNPMLKHTPMSMHRCRAVPVHWRHLPPAVPLLRTVRTHTHSPPHLNPSSSIGSQH